jgi:transketolase
MGMAEMAVALWHQHLSHNPADPGWINRDRFVLSNGHASMLIYALLHLTGYDLGLNDLKQFRQLHSRTPGHPEVDVTPGVETTTGPLGQGIANAVGMALAERLLAQEFNQGDLAPIDHLTYVFMGDGCLMEGISHEVCSLAGTWGLSKLIVLWDNNGISIDGEVKHWFAEDVVARFQSYGWNVIDGIDGHDISAVGAALGQAKDWARKGRPDAQGSVRFAPTLIACKTRIGQGSPNRAGTAKAHGEPLGPEEIALTRAQLGWTEPAFVIPDPIAQQWNLRARGERTQAQWDEVFARYQASYPDKAAELQRRLRGELPLDWDEQIDDALAAAQAVTDPVATRKASQNLLQVLGPRCPELLGGSADLTGSNLTDFKGAGALRSTPGSFSFGRHINYGVREFGMAAILNGVALHGGYIPYGGTFLTFSDYSRNAIRMAALMKRRVIHVFTHDSIGLGEDGPTHQAVEHAASLRLIPHLDVWRPADSVETAVAWIEAIERKDGPSALLLSRQNLPAVTRSDTQNEAIRRGAYILRDAHEAQAVLVATGSELALALAAREALAEHGIGVRVVSMPCTSRFDRQSETYKANVMPARLPRIAIEAGVTDLWWKYGCAAVVGLDRYGESAPGGVLFKTFGFTVSNVVDTVREALRRAKTH